MLIFSQPHLCVEDRRALLPAGAPETLLIFYEGTLLENLGASF
jgi:hypothetical protein